jgi:hypothetical protein
MCGLAPLQVSQLFNEKAYLSQVRSGLKQSRVVTRLSLPVGEPLDRPQYTIESSVATAVPLRPGILRRHLGGPDREPVAAAGHSVAAAGVRPHA